MPANNDLLGLVSNIVSAHLSNNNVAAGDLPELIRVTYAAIAGLDEEKVPAVADKLKPAISARKSLADPSHILSMIDGRRYVMLKRHLAQNGMTPAEYRDRFDLPADYPMTAKAYSERRREFARASRLRQRRNEAEVSAPPAPAKTERKPRAKKADTACDRT